MNSCALLQIMSAKIKITRATLRFFFCCVRIEKRVCKRIDFSCVWKSQCFEQLAYCCCFPFLFWLIESWKIQIDITNFNALKHTIHIRTKSSIHQFRKIYLNFSDEFLGVKISFLKRQNFFPLPNLIARRWNQSMTFTLVLSIRRMKKRVKNKCRKEFLISMGFFKRPRPRRKEKISFHFIQIWIGNEDGYSSIFFSRYFHMISFIFSFILVLCTFRLSFFIGCCCVRLFLST